MGRNIFSTLYLRLFEETNLQCWCDYKVESMFPSSINNKVSTVGVVQESGMNDKILFCHTRQIMCSMVI